MQLAKDETVEPKWKSDHEPTIFGPVTSGQYVCPDGYKYQSPNDYFYWVGDIARKGDGKCHKQGSTAKPAQ